MNKILLVATFLAAGLTASAQTKKKSTASFTPPVIAQTEAVPPKFTPPVIRKKPVRKVKREQPVFAPPVIKKDN